MVKLSKANGEHAPTVGRSMRWPKQQLSTSEVSQYVSDLQRISLLRDKSSGTERERYDTVIKVMQLVLLELHKV